MAILLKTRVFNFNLISLINIEALIYDGMRIKLLHTMKIKSEKSKQTLNNIW